MVSFGMVLIAVGVLWFASVAAVRMQNPHRDIFYMLIPSLALVALGAAMLVM